MRWAITIMSWTRAVMNALLKHARFLAGVLHKNSKKLSGIFPNLNDLVSAMSAQLPKPFADNVEASGGDVLSMLKTALITVSITVVLYWVGYYFVAELARAGTKGLAQFFTYVIPFYPPLYPEDLFMEDIDAMWRTAILLAIIFTITALYIKHKRKKLC